MESQNQGEDYVESHGLNEELHPANWIYGYNPDNDVEEKMDPSKW